MASEMTLDEFGQGVWMDEQWWWVVGETVPLGRLVLENEDERTRTVPRKQFAGLVLAGQTRSQDGDR